MLPDHTSSFAEPTDQIRDIAATRVIAIRFLVAILPGSGIRADSLSAIPSFVLAALWFFCGSVASQDVFSKVKKVERYVMCVV